MHYWIDGYNLLFYGKESKKSLTSQRHAIITFLQKEFFFLSLEGTIVFDGLHRSDEQSGLSYKSPLVIAYSPYGQTADQYILEKIEISPSPSQIIVITNDQSLTFQSKTLGARTLNLPSFFALLKKKHFQKRKPFEEKQVPSQSQREIDRFLKIFQERLQSDD